MFTRFDEVLAMPLQDITVKMLLTYGRNDARMDGQRENSVSSTKMFAGCIKTSNPNNIYCEDLNNSVSGL